MKFKLNEILLCEGKNKERTFQQYKNKIKKAAQEQSRFPDLLENEDNVRVVFNNILDKDPTYTGGDTTGDYGTWLLNMYCSGDWFEFVLTLNDVREDFRDMLSTFIKLKSNLPKKDINQYKSCKELAQVLTDTDFSPRQKERQMRNNMRDAKLVFSGDKFDVFVPTTYESSCTLGKGTLWCTADSRTREYWDYYNKEGHKLYILINRNDPTDKYQFSDSSYEFKDDRDDTYAMDYIEDERTLKFLQDIIYEDMSPNQKLFCKELHLDPQWLMDADDGYTFRIYNATTNGELMKEVSKDHFFNRKLVDEAERVLLTREHYSTNDIDSLFMDYLGISEYKFLPDGRCLVVWSV